MTNEIPLSRVEAAAFLLETYGKVAAVTSKTLAKLAHTGGGPRFQHFGRKPGYSRADLMAWVESRTSPLRTSTSDKSGAENGR